METFDEETDVMVVKLSGEILDLLFNKIKSEKYSPHTIAINVLIISIFRWVFPLIEENDENNFIVEVGKIIKHNFNANRKVKNANRAAAPSENDR